MTNRVALIVGAGPGISAAFAEALVADGYHVALASRNVERLSPLAKQMNAKAFDVDASSPASVVRLFSEVDAAVGEPEVVLFNPSARIRGDLLTLDIDAAAAAIQTTAIGALVTAQEAAGGCYPRVAAVFFLQEQLLVSRDLRDRRCLRWGSLRCGDSRRASLGSWGLRGSMWCTSS